MKRAPRRTQRSIQKISQPEPEKSEKDLLLPGLLVLALLLSVFNFYQLSTIDAADGETATTPTSVSSVIPRGVPKIYGQELGVGFDDVDPNNPRKADATIRVLGALDTNIQLTEEQKERYVNILYRMGGGIACEYCCGARSVIFENGEPACGCAHSFAMRGLAKYLITKHGSEYSDEEILEEVGKWKTLFFPAQITQKAAVLKEQGIELNYINLASNKYRGAEKGSGTSGGMGMVGGC